MKVLNTKEFLEGLNIGKLNIRDIKLPELRLLPGELVKKYKLVFNKITNRYDCDSNVRVKTDLVKDGKLITDFGVVKGFFDCSENNLTSLEGCPNKINGDFTCSYNRLTSLEGSPAEIGGNFNCCDNNLVSLEGCPAKINGNFDCYNNNLTSLEGGPVEVGGYFTCSENNLTSLEGCPKIVGRWFGCIGNELTSLKGCPTKVGNTFWCNNQKNEHKFTEDEVKTLCDVKEKIYV